MTTTPVLGADELVSGQAIPETTENQRGRRFEQGAQYFNVFDRTLTTPPVSPADGDAHIVGASATGAWSGKDKAIAYYQSGTGWLFITPRTGFRAYSQADSADYRYASGAWTVVTAGSSGGLLAANNLSDVANVATARGNLSVYSQSQVDSAIGAAVAGLSWKQAVRAATTTAGTLASSFGNGSTVDGVTLATGDRILIKNQATGSENGIYIVAASGAPARATDADSGAELVNASCYVSEGTANADTQWTCTTNAPITIGSTSLAFAQLTSGGSGTVTSVATAGLATGGPITGSGTVTVTAAAASDVKAGTSTTKAVTPSALSGSAAVQTLTDAATIAWDMSLGFNAKVQITNNRTLGTPTNPIEGLTYTLAVQQDGTGSRTMTWPASFDWGTAGAPTLTTTASKVDQITLQCTDAVTPKFRAYCSGKGFAS